MARYSIAEAEESLTAFIDKALAGEDVTLTRDGEAVVELLAKRPTVSFTSSERSRVAIAEGAAGRTWIARSRIWFQSSARCAIASRDDRSPFVWLYEIVERAMRKFHLIFGTVMFTAAIAYPT